MLIEIEPALDGALYDDDRLCISCIAIAPRHIGSSLYPINRWPMHVYVALLPPGACSRDVFKTGDYNLIAWAELYPDENRARLKE
jgi:hypothetical protein